MANEIDGEKNGCSFQWKIVNINHCLLKKGELIESPTFVADALESTKWSLILYPMGITDENYVGFYLQRDRNYSGPNKMEVNFHLAFLGKDGSFLKEVTSPKYKFQKTDYWGCGRFETIEKVFVTEREAFLPEDSLTVQCTLWSNEEKPATSKYSYARTVFKTIRRSVMWRIHEFKTLKSALRKKFRDNLIEFDLVLNEGLNIEKKLAINISAFDKSINHLSFKSSIVDSDGKKENCGTLEYFADDLKRGVLSSISLLDKKLMVNKSKYFINGVLSLNCEYKISAQTDVYEFFGPGITFPKVTNEAVESINEHYIEKEKSINTPVLINDLKCMYNDARFSDMELRTSTQSFQVHKAMLSARSPFFRRRLSIYLEDNSSGYLELTDLDDDTMHRVLTYIYTESLEILHINSASKLYAAAVKFEIPSLKKRCSSFLKKKLCPTKACEIFLLAHQHEDVDLKCFVQDYIMEHDKEVFGSQEWKDFMGTHLELSAHIMYRKVYPVLRSTYEMR